MNEIELEFEGDLEKSAMVQKLLSKVAWGLKTPFAGRKAGEVLNAVERLEELGFSRREILASTVGTEKALEVSLIEEIAKPVPAE